MKKKILAVSLIASFATLLNATDFDTKVSVGATSAELDGKQYTQYGVGYTSNTILNNGIIVGFGNSAYYGNVKRGIEVLTLDMDLKAGYEVYTNLRAFALGTGAYQYLDDDTATGFGYGGALEYKLTQTVSLEGSYKTMDMKNAKGDYDYDTTNFAVKFHY